MPTLLDQIIDGATDDSVSTANLLRKVQIAATRVGADDVSDWARHELSGYDPKAELPKYRTMVTPVMGLFTGVMQSRIQQALQPHLDFLEQFTINMRQPLAEVQAFASGNDGVRSEWVATEVQRYREAEIFAIEFHYLFSAWNVISRQALIGIIDTIRNKAMEFALALQVEFPDAGSIGGPSLATSSSIAPVVFNTTNNIYGHSNTVATGASTAQKTKLMGNRDEFLQQLQQLGLNKNDAVEFAEILDTDKSTESTKSVSFLNKVRSGAIALGLSISSDVVAGSLVELARLYLGS